MAHIVSLIPLDRALHMAALQGVYAATPSYWAMYDLDGPPSNHADKELVAAAAEPGRILLGIVRRLDPADPDAGAEMIGFVDFRLDWPDPGVVYIGMLMVAEAVQRQGIGTQAWSLLKPWLASQAGMQRARAGVEQFNVAALKFWEAQGFTVTGESNRIRVGDKFIRQLYMQQPLASG